MASFASAPQTDPRKKLTAKALIPRGGAPLERRLRERFASRLGADFSRVRIHADSTADVMAQALDAQAYTLGNHIVFRNGRFRPDSPQGEKLLIHELSHVAQQATTSPSMDRAPKISDPHDAAEREADRIADHFAAGSTASMPPASHAESGPMLLRRPIGSNGFGKFDLEQVPMSAAAAGDEYSHRIKLTFAPDPKTVNASEIAFVQAVYVTGDPGWAIDSVTQRGYVGYDEDGKPYKAERPGGLGARYVVEPGSSPTPLKNAVTRDWPGWNVPNTSWSFNTAAVAKRGTDLGLVYGTVTWGFEVDGDNKIDPHKAAFHDVPGQAWKGAVAKWNAQAAGPVAKRVAPDQQQLPAFKYATP